MSETNSETNSVKKVKPVSSSSNNYVRTFRHGAIAANVFCRTAPGGLEYLDFSISRSWKTNTDKEGYSQRFFAKNREAMKLVIDDACDFITESPTGAKRAATNDNGKSTSPRAPSA
jgi:hypothetical protein